MDPAQPHGLGEDFVKAVLQKSLVGVPPDSIPITPIDLDVWSLDNLEVRREWRNIDILLIDEEHKFVVIIENKVTGGEHSEQLIRYRKIIKDRFPEYKRLGLYLNPEGVTPSDEWYIPISYDLIAELVKRFVQTRQSTLGPDVLTMMKHYEQMLRRHIVSESEITELCRRIYKKHQRALDMIYEYRPDLQEELRYFLEELAGETPGTVMDHCTKSRIRFTFEDLDFLELQEGEGWTDSGRMLLFEFANYSDRLALALIVGPGPIEIRQKLFDLAQENQPPFDVAFKNLGKKFNTIYSQNLLISKHYEEADLEEMEEVIRGKWEHFLNSTYPKLREKIIQQDWLQENY